MYFKKSRSEVIRKGGVQAINMQSKGVQLEKIQQKTLVKCLSKDCCGIITHPTCAYAMWLAMPGPQVGLTQEEAEVGHPAHWSPVHQQPNPLQCS